MNSEWQETLLANLLTFANGKTSPSRLEKFPYPVFGSNGIIGYSEEVNTSKSSIIIGRVGSYCGSVYFSDSDCWVTDNAIYALPKGENDPKFFYYLLSNLNLNQWRSGSGQPLLNQSILNSISVKVPSSQTQQAIADILNSLDEKIELNRQMSKTLEDIASTLFKSWFIDFDPVKAKAAGQEPEGLSPEIAALFPDSFVDSPLGKIPKGWKYCTIGSKLTTILGGTPSRLKPEYWTNGSVPWINSGKTNEFRIIKPTERITQEALLKSATKLLPARTTVLAITGATLGQVSITEIECCANQSVVGILANDLIPTEFIYLWVKKNIDKLISAQTGGAQQHINKGNVNELALVCPNHQILNVYRNQASPIFDKISMTCFQSENLVTLRNLLLPKLINGEIEIQDAEILLSSIT